jgi:D-alanine--poly(phosphoribitol) ligase subunit 1
MTRKTRSSSRCRTAAMYRSGDLGYVLPDGNLAFLRRQDTQIMIYGKRVEVAEVESRLYQCKNVRQAVVRAFTDEDGLSYMTAYVVPADADMKVSAVKKELAENLTPFMIPEFIVKMPSIPLNTNGKPDVARLPVVMKAGAYEHGRDKRGRPCRPGRSYDVAGRSPAGSILHT